MFCWKQIIATPLSPCLVYVHVGLLYQLKKKSKVQVFVWYFRGGGKFGVTNLLNFILELKVLLAHAMKAYRNKGGTTPLIFDLNTG